MAVSSSSYFSNSIVGQIQVGSDIDIYRVDSTPKYSVGIGFVRGDGNKYRYSHFGALSNRGLLVAQDYIESSLTSTNLNAGALIANITKPAGEIVNPNTAGSHYVQAVVTATANQFDGAYLSVIDQGFQYRIKNTTATGDPVTGNCYLELYEPLAATVDSNSDFLVTGCPYANLEPAVAVTSTTGFTAVSGVTVANNSSTNYGWIQTGGVATILASARVGSVGSLAVLSTNTAGAVCYASTDAATTANGLGWSPIVGYFLNPVSASAYAVVKLMLE